MKTQQQLHREADRTKHSAAHVARRQIYSLVRNIGEQEETLRPSDERERRVWANIVRYANADLLAEAKGYLCLLRALYELTPTPELTEFKLIEFGDGADFFSLSELGGARKSDLIALSIHYQKPLKNLLLWLCQPKSRAAIRLEVLRFLEVNVRGEDWHIDYSEDPIRDLDEDKSPFLYFIKQVKFGSIVGPVCKFIFEYADEPPKALPIRVCKRPGCDKLILPQRLGRKEYCSRKCCGLDHRPGRAENKDYMWLYRLNKIKSDGTLRKKIRENADTLERLRRLESRWRNQSKFKARIEEIRARARL